MTLCDTNIATVIVLIGQSIAVRNVVLKKMLSADTLRTAPTKYKGFCARLGPCGKSRSLQGLLESTKKKRGSHAFFRDN